MCFSASEVFTFLCIRKYQYSTIIILKKKQIEIFVAPPPFSIEMNTVYVETHYHGINRHSLYKVVI